MKLSSLRRLLLAVAIVLVAALVLGVGYKAYTKGMDHWLGSYVAWSRSRAEGHAGPVHVMFLVVDHFEMGAKAEETAQWAQAYRRVAAGHRDADGRPPRHTWFCPAEQFHAPQMAVLDKLCRAGYGEVELHLHHAHDRGTALRARIAKAQQDFGRYGALTTAGRVPQHRFAFVHGNMSLDNCRGAAYCGVNDEIAVLQQMGCFADFTFPSIERRSQPAVVNRLYYALDDPRLPGSYLAGGAEMAVGKPQPGLLMFQGPLVIDFGNWSHIFYPALDIASLDPTNPPTPHRVDRWVAAGIHVRGRPEWVFVKTFVHGAQRGARSHVVGGDAGRMFTYLETHYNDGRRYVLHYVTAREAYNIAKAAEAGKTGDPGRYRDYLIKPYRNAQWAGAPRRAPVRVGAPRRSAIPTRTESRVVR